MSELKNYNCHPFPVNWRMRLKITIALREVKENQEEVAFEEMMRRQYNMAPTLTQCNVVQYITRQYRTIYRIQYNTIQYDTNSTATIAIKNDISRWG